MSKKTVIGLLALCILATQLASCARDYQLNIQANSKSIRDVAPIDGNGRDLPYETLEKNGISVGYNLLAGYIGNTYGYTLRLVFRNTGTNRLVIYPKVTLFDADGFVQSNDIKSIVSRAYRKKAEVSINIYTEGRRGPATLEERERANDDVMLA